MSSSPFIKISRRPATAALPTFLEPYDRGQLRVLSGDGATTADKLYFGRDNAGTGAWDEVQVGTPLTTKGDLLVHTTVTTRKAVGANGTVLSADSSQADGVKWATLPSLMPGVIFGGWVSQSNYTFAGMVGGINGTAAGAALTADSMVASLFAVPVATTFDQITAKVTTGVAASTIRLGVYAVGTNGLPGALIADWGTVSSATTSNPTLSISWSPVAGWYYLVQVSSSNPSVTSYANGLGVTPFGSGAGITTLAGITDWIKASAGSSSALPNPFGSSPSGTGTHRPLWLRPA